MRSTPDHMLRIGAPHGRRRARSSSCPGLGCVAAAARTARTASCGSRSPRTRTRASPRTRDRFGGASWLERRGGRDFTEWPLELYKLTLAPPPPELEGHVAIVTGAASGIGREIAADLAGRGAEVSPPTSTTPTSRAT
jgi:hypothetical protein